MTKINKGYKKQLVIDTRHCLKDKKKKKEEEYGCKQCQKLLEEKRIKIKEYGKQYRQDMSEKDKQAKKKNEKILKKSFLQ